MANQQVVHPFRRRSRGHKACLPEGTPTSMATKKKALNLLGSVLVESLII